MNRSSEGHKPSIKDVFGKIFPPKTPKPPQKTLEEMSEKLQNQTHQYLINSAKEKEEEYQTS